MQLRDDGNGKQIPFPNHWNFLGGHALEGEDPAFAAARELEEEIDVSIDASELQLIHCYSHPHADLDYVFAARVERWCNVKTLEGARITWVPLHDIYNLKLGFGQESIVPFIEKLISSNRAVEPQMAWPASCKPTAPAQTYDQQADQTSPAEMVETCREAILTFERIARTVSQFNGSAHADAPDRLRMVAASLFSRPTQLFALLAEYDARLSRVPALISLELMYERMERLARKAAHIADASSGKKAGEIFDLKREFEILIDLAQAAIDDLTRAMKSHSDATGPRSGLGRAAALLGFVGRGGILDQRSLGAGQRVEARQNVRTLLNQRGTIRTPMLQAKCLIRDVTATAVCVVTRATIGVTERAAVVFETGRELTGVVTRKRDQSAVVITFDQCLSANDPLLQP